MKKSLKAPLKQCHLELVETVPWKPLPGVPEHFNYGVFFDDGFDYMQYLKSAAELNDRQVFRIAEIPENKPVPVNDQDAATSYVREPVVDEPEVPEEAFDPPSDFEDESTELEDNFIELAGGKPVRCDDSDEIDENDELRQRVPPTSRNKLSQDKVMMMERFLYGDNEGALEHSSFSDASDESLSGDFETMDDDTILNRQFEKLMLRCKNRAKSASQSAVTGTSMMSEGLLYGLSRDKRILPHQHCRQEELEELEEDVKIRTMERAMDFEEKVSTSPDPDSSSNSSDSISDIISSHSVQPSSKPNYLVLATSTSGRRSHISSEEALTKDDVAEANVPHLDPELLVRKKGESNHEKRLRKAAVKQHKAERKRIQKLNRGNFHAEQRKRLNSRPPTIVIN